MELGSEEHKKLLLKSIVRTALRIVSMGFFVGLLLMIPFIFRENAFSSGLFFMGTGIMLGTVIYALVLTKKKYKKLIKPFEKEGS